MALGLGSVRSRMPFGAVPPVPVPAMTTIERVATRDRGIGAGEA
jgi:hypothetical protein